MRLRKRRCCVWEIGQENGNQQPAVLCKCECGKENGAEVWTEEFDADSLDAMEHDGETRTHITYLCDECAKKYGRNVTR